MGTKFEQLKNWLKTSAVEIRLRRSLFKDNERNGYFNYAWNSKESRQYWDNVSNLYKLRREHRHKHIAYSELRGKTRKQIEASYPYTNQPDCLRPDEKWIDKIKSEYTDQSCVADRLGGGF